MELEAIFATHRCSSSVELWNQLPVFVPKVSMGILWHTRVQASFIALTLTLSYPRSNYLHIHVVYGLPRASASVLVWAHCLRTALTFRLWLLHIGCRLHQPKWVLESLLGQAVALPFDHYDWATKFHVLTLGGIGEWSWTSSSDAIMPALSCSLHQKMIHVWGRRRWLWHHHHHLYIAFDDSIIINVAIIDNTNTTSAIAVFSLLHSSHSLPQSLSSVSQTIKLFIRKYPSKLMCPMSKLSALYLQAGETSLLIHIVRKHTTPLPESKMPSKTNFVKIDFVAWFLIVLDCFWPVPIAPSSHNIPGCEAVVQAIYSNITHMCGRIHHSAHSCVWYLGVSSIFVLPQFKFHLEAGLHPEIGFMILLVIVIEIGVVNVWVFLL